MCFPCIPLLALFRLLQITQQKLSFQSQSNLARVWVFFLSEDTDLIDFIEIYSHCQNYLYPKPGNIFLKSKELHFVLHIILKEKKISN